MSHARPSGRRLAAAVTVALAVTAGLTGTSGPAGAAPSASVSATARQAADQSAVPFPAGHRIVGVTESGYLTKAPSSVAHSWMRASDGAVTALPDGVIVSATGADDLLAVSTPYDARLEDAATGEQPVRIRLRAGGGTGAYAGAAGRALFSTASRAEGGIDLRMHTEGDTTSTVISWPRGVNAVSVRAGTSSHALLTYRTLGDGFFTYHWALIDLAAGIVTETGQRGDLGTGDIAVSANHVAWVEYGTEGPSIVVHTRATGEKRRIATFAGLIARDIKVGLQGDHLVYGDPGGLTDTYESTLHDLTAHNLRTGATTHLLDHLTSAATAPDGVLHVRGGTVGGGEGLYRITPDAGGTPTASLVASTGEPTGLALVGHDVPAVIDLGRDRGRVKLRWTLTRNNAELRVTLRHVRTGMSAQQVFQGPEATNFTFDWRGAVDQGRATAPNGDYTWEITARPRNGIGPAVSSSGTFTVTRGPAPHDFNDNGSPDLLARDSGGGLHRVDTHFDTLDDQLVSAETELVGGGWNTYDQIEAAGDIGGASTGDLVARDKAGVLWHYLGKGDGTFAARTRIGGGWGVYDKIAAGSDVTDDGKSDLLATDKSGVLWLYKGTGDWRAPFAGRVKAGTGYGAYNQITATGDIGGAKTGDLIARDDAGVLWLHLGKGDGTFAARTRIGGGWGVYEYIVGTGDADRDGRPDLYAYGTEGTFHYSGTGDWRAPFGSRQGAPALGTYPDHTAVS
ncbi:FG-GAP repeat domain-containing protein [Streptomyces sp. NPDC059459]|uniref:FG-GAP repeat domain-containing protein n=1 Tax=Streptomyces sp. NPDC059459 TaxID=3346839 RepID=UPI0036D0742D